MVASYVGQKPFNWPAAILMGGWFAAMLLLMSDAGRFVSLFGRSLRDTPLFWSTEMDFVGFALLMTPFALGALALWLMPLVDWSRSVSAALLAIGGLAMALGIVWDIQSGTAIYADRVVHREPGFFASESTESFSDITLIETACILERERRSSTRTPVIDYAAHFRSGYVLRLDVDREFILSTSRRGPKLRAVQAVDSAANRISARRAPRRDVNGRVLMDSRCIGPLASGLGVQPAEIAPLFMVNRAELREGEYTVGEP